MERDEPRRASEAEILTRGLKTHPDATHTHTYKIAVKTRKSLAYFSIHKSFFIHAYYQKNTSKPFFSKRKFTKTLPPPDL